MVVDPDATRAVQTWLVELSAAECTDLLTTTPLGRLGVVVEGRPEIFPVNHMYDETSGCVVFPTNRRTKLHAALDWPWVAYEIDGETPDGSGWSVMVVGKAETITDVDRIAGIAPRRTAGWAASGDATWVRIVPSKITGRRISAVACA